VRSFALRIVVVLLATVVLALPAQAQRRRMSGGRAVAAERPQVGAHIGYNFDFSEAVIGAQATFPVARQVDLYPSFDFYTVSGGSLWAVNLDGRFKPPMRSAYATLYVGAGLNIMHTSAAGFGNTDTHLNLLAGLEARRGPMRPFGEARLILGNGSAFQIQGGVNFRLH